MASSLTTIILNGRGHGSSILSGNESHPPGQGQGGGLTLQVRFVTKQESFAVPDYPFALGANVGASELNSLVNKVLTDDGVIEKPKAFDFLIGGEFLRGTLEELVLRHEAIKFSKPFVVDGDDAETTKSSIPVGVEEIVEVEYVESYPPPEPKDCLIHDDWVSAVDANDHWVLTGCYDNSLHLWSSKGKHKNRFGGHSGPVKTVSWIHCDSSSAVFASGSQDQTIMIWEWDMENKSVRCKWVCKGHQRSVESMKHHTDSSMLASGSWDGQLKIWSSSVEPDTRDGKLDDEEPMEETGSNKPLSRAPIMTLAGHKESISALDWTENHEVITGSWDHTIKIWDIEMGGIKSEVAGQKAFFSLSWSTLNKTVITSSADRHIRLYDARSNEGSLVKATFTSHSGWISSVNWSTTNENLFISGSHDKLMKLWDRRSPRAPLFSMTGHTENILCTSWSNPKYLMSGAADNSLRIFKAKAPTNEL